jgi:hypothetical protein
MSDGFPMFRKIGTNIGLLRYSGAWYISDCGNEFAATGENHLDYYNCAAPVDGFPSQGLWKVADDGVSPPPHVKICDQNGIRTLLLALRAGATTHMEKGQYEEAMVELESILSIGSVRIDDYILLAQTYMRMHKAKEAWLILTDLCENTDLVSKYNTMDIRTLVSDTMREVHMSMVPSPTVTDYVRILQNKNIYPFIEFTVYICEKLKGKIGDLESMGRASSTDQPVNTDPAFIEALLTRASQQREFRLAGGVEVATQLRDFYRAIQNYTFSERDCAIWRMKIFSFADLFRQWSSDGRLDIKGRDAGFKIFWEVGMNPSEKPTTCDPREVEARTKDNDPSKEIKCSVIKSINEGGSEDFVKFTSQRSRLMAMTNRKYTLADINMHDCNNIILKLISIHGVIFDVTENLEKYAPDGEYFFFAGHDITYPLAISALSGDYVDHMYKLTSVDHLKRVYGWMSYFEGKYKVAGTLVEWEKEYDFPDPPEGEDEMQCTIM